MKLSNDLKMCGCPFADQLTDVIHLRPLRQRFAQWIFSRFVQQPMDQTEIDLVELSTCLGLSSDPNIVKGECSVDDFLLFLRRATDLLGAKMSLSSSNMSDVNDEFEREQIVDNHCQMLRYVADNHSQVLSDECRLFPLDIPVQNDLGKADFQERTSSLTRQLASLKAELQVFLNSSATHSLSSSDNEGHTLRVIKMKSSLSRLQNVVSDFNLLYSTSLFGWTNQTAPKFSGLGESAQTVESLRQTVEEFSRATRSISESYRSVGEGSEVSQSIKTVHNENIFSEASISSLLNSISVLERSLERRKVQATVSLPVISGMLQSINL
eukprot:97448_1